MNTKTIKYKGIELLVQDFSLGYDDEILLMRIRESQRRANIGGIKHEPGNRVMSDIPIDVEFSKLCCEVWK